MALTNHCSFIAFAASIVISVFSFSGGGMTMEFMTLEPIRRSLHRHTLFLGGDRELVMFSGLGAILTALGGFSPSAAFSALAFWLVALYWLRKWAKADPLLRQVWLRHIRQQDFYPARTGVWSNPRGQSPWK